MIKQKGFTLIELLVAIGIMMFLVGGAIVGYISFNERQKFIQAGEIVREVLESTQIKARSGKIGGCDELTGYQITLSNSNDTGMITIVPICRLMGIAETTSYYLPSQISFANNVIMYIHAVGGEFDNDLTKGNDDPEWIDFSLLGTQSNTLRVHRFGFFVTQEEMMEPSPTPIIVPSPTPDYLIPTPEEICCSLLKPPEACGGYWVCNPSLCRWECSLGQYD